MRFSPRTLGVLAALVPVALVGCGDDSDEPLTRAEYVKQADAICKKFDTQAGKITEPKSIADLERVAEETKPLLASELKELRALRAPDELEKDTSAAYSLLEQSLPKLDQLAEAGRKKDAAAIQKIAEDAGKLSKDADERAKRIGLKVCGSS